MNSVFLPCDWSQQASNMNKKIDSPPFGSEHVLEPVGKDIKWIDQGNLQDTEDNAEMERSPGELS